MDRAASVAAVNFDSCIRFQIQKIRFLVDAKYLDAKERSKYSFECQRAGKRVQIVAIIWSDEYLITRPPKVTPHPQRNQQQAEDAAPGRPRDSQLAVFHHAALLS